MDTEKAFSISSGRPRPHEMSDTARQLCDNIHALSASKEARPHATLPSRAAIVEMMGALRGVVFPGYFGTAELKTDATYFHVGATLHRVALTLEEQIGRALCFVSDTDTTDCAHRARDVVLSVIAQLPAIQEHLLSDVQAAYEGDPAATSPDETILCYPGVLAITHYRFAHALHALGIPIIPRIITEHAHSITGIDIHPGATIGQRFFIDHGTGVVIGETTEIGRNVRIYQGVTLGARSFPMDEHGNLVKGIKRHPIVEDDVTIYSGATILGRITIGRGSIIGGNVWVTQNVPAGTFVTQTAARREAFEMGSGI